jgi:hypothetical protein
MTANPKNAPIRDRKYLNSQHRARCTFTGRVSTEAETVEPAHIGAAGMGLKSGDDETLPLSHTMHALSHRIGFAQLVRQFAPDAFIVAAVRAYCRERYREWLTKEGKRDARERMDAGIDR